MAVNPDICTDIMLGGKWRKWCRLCAKTNAEYTNVVTGHCEEFMNENSFKCYKDLANVVLEFFRINIKEDDKFPQIICKECHEFVLELIKFSERASKVQQMYNDLQNSIDKSAAELQVLLENYDINAYKDEVMIPHSGMELPVEEIFVADFVQATLSTKTNVKNEKAATEQQEEPTMSKDEKQTELDDPFACDDDRDMDYGESASSSSSTEDGDSSSDNEYNVKNESVTKVNDRPKRASTIKIKLSTTTTDLSEEQTKLETTTRISEDPANNSYCQICAENFKRRANYTRHMKQKHGLLNCRSCASLFENDTDLKKHIKEKHGKVWNCPHCEQTFSRKGLRSDHIRMEHSTISTNKSSSTSKKPKIKSTPTNINRSFVCPVCNQTYPQKKQRKQHMLEKHPDYEPNVCNICGRIFKEKSSLKKHLERHGDKFMCSQCGKQLTCQASLTSHMLVHSDITPHKCDVCGRAFKRPKALKYHLIAHTGLRPYPCDFCEKTFSTGSSCRLHKKTMHPNELAAQEASGVVQYTKNVPKLADLRAVARTGTNFRPLMSKQNGYAPIPKDGAVTAGFSN